MSVRVRALQMDVYPDEVRAATIAAIDAVLAMTPVRGVVIEQDIASAHEALPLPDGLPDLISVAAEPQAGKDEIANYLQSRYGDRVGRLAFSDAIIDEVNAFLADHDEPGAAHVIHEGNKNTPEYRTLLQKWGMGRRYEDADYWTRQVQAKANRLRADHDLVIATGIRIPVDPVTGEILNLRDIECLREVGGQVWRVDRPGNLYRAQDIVEMGLSRLGDAVFDRVVLNDREGDLAHYHRRIHDTLMSYLSE